MLVAFEGIDGSGKATQARMLHERLNTADTGAVLFSFPAYDRTVFGPHVKRYLSGDFGPLGSNDPFLVSLLYGIDRLESRGELERVAFSDDIIAICDRYVPSNIAHQGANTTPERLQRLISDIETAEYDVFKLPRPDLVILFELTAEQSFRRTHVRDTEPDLHQDSISYMARVREVYLELARTRQSWEVVECLDADGKDRSIEEIHAQVWEIVSAARDKTVN